MTVACAGHPPAIFVSDADEPARLDAHGDLLGIWPEIRLVQLGRVGTAVGGEAPERTEHEALADDGNGRRPAAPHGNPHRSGGRGVQARRPVA